LPLLILKPPPTWWGGGEVIKIDLKCLTFHTPKLTPLLSLFVYFKAIAYLERNDITIVHPVQFINSVSD
jgi:hypothetical protein